MVEIKFGRGFYESYSSFFKEVFVRVSININLLCVVCWVGRYLRKYVIFLLLRDFSLFGDIGYNFEKISDFKCEIEVFWEGIIKELILKKRIVFVFLLLFKMLSINLLIIIYRVIIMC